MTAGASLDRLRDRLRALDRVVVAFSGGAGNLSAAPGTIGVGLRVNANQVSYTRVEATVVPSPGRAALAFQIVITLNPGDAVQVAVETVPTAMNVLSSNLTLVCLTP